MKKLIILLSILMINTSSKPIEYCDIKGNVKNPGVYEIKDNYTIQDIINDAGGLTKNAHTNNINLSKKVIDEMVIYIFDKNEIKKIEELNSCVCKPIYKYAECINDNKDKKTTSVSTTESITKEITTTNTTTKNIIETTTMKAKKININMCTKEELLTLDGLGEKKVLSIIEYRENNGDFKTIEDILNVNGIGKTTFEKIKDYIEV